MSTLKSLQTAIRGRWGDDVRYPRAMAYADKFFDTRYSADKVWGKVVGNHGTYTVSIRVEGGQLMAACSCYIGKEGYCHHVDALAIAVQDAPHQFEWFPRKRREDVHDLNTLREYLDSVTLADILADLKARGVTQKAIAKTLGMSPRHLSAMKSSELRNRFLDELGATKLACVWILEKVGETASAG